jgi:phage-related holin
VTGFILLIVIAFLAAWLVNKVGKRVRVNMSNKRIVGFVVVFIIVALALWGQKGVHK